MHGHLVAEDTMQFGLKTWGNQGGTGQEVFSLLAILYNPGWSYAGCCGRGMSSTVLLSCESCKLQ